MSDPYYIDAKMAREWAAEEWATMKMDAAAENERADLYSGYFDMEAAEEELARLDAIAVR
jgi:hypothetical protein